MMVFRLLLRRAWLGSLAASLLPVAAGQQAITGTYTQNFDGIGGGLPANWTVRTGANATALGSTAAFTTAHVAWTSTSGQFANFASSPGPDASTTTDRALGIRQTAAYGDPGASFNFHFSTTGVTISALSVDLEMLSVQPRSTTWTIQYGIGAAPATWVDLGTFSDPGTTGVTTRSFTSAAFGTALDNQSNVWFRVVALAVSSSTGSRDTFAIDSFSLTVGAGGGPTNPVVIGSSLPTSIANDGVALVRILGSVTSGTNPTSSGLAVTGDFTALGGSATQTLFDDGSNGDQVAGDNLFTFRTTVPGSVAPGLKTIPLTVTDAQARSGSGSSSVTVTGPVVVTPIWQIQGSGLASPLLGSTVTTAGIVTARRTNGFFVQAPPPGDGDALTSDGIFVFTSTTPTPLVGDSVQVTGTVAEFNTAVPAGLRSNQLTSPVVVVLSSGNPLPPATPIDVTIATTATAQDPLRYRRFDAMRVSVASGTAVSSTSASLTESTATTTSTGRFDFVPAGTPRPFREPGIDRPLPTSIGSQTIPAGVPVFDSNPERITFNSRGQEGVTTNFDASAGSTFTGAVGVLQLFTFSTRPHGATYNLYPDGSALAGIIASNTNIPTPTAVPAQGANEVTVGSLNMERFFDSTANGNGATTLTSTAYQMRLEKASRLIREIMRSPDVIGLQEIEAASASSSSTPTAITDLVARIAADGGPAYTSYLGLTNDVGGINVAFLVRGTVTVVDADPSTPGFDSSLQIERLQQFLSATGSPTSLLHDRPSHLIRVQSPTGLTFTVINNHLRSLSSIEGTAAGSDGYTTDGDRVRSKRNQQAISLANFIRSRQAANPAERILLVGDFNAFGVNDGYVDVLGTVMGLPTPSTQVVLGPSSPFPYVPAYHPPSPALVGLTSHAAFVPADQQYSFNFGGNAQQLDHAIVTPTLLPLVKRVNYGRVNTDFAEINYSVGTVPTRLSDHDPVVVTLDARPYSLWKLAHLGTITPPGGDNGTPAGDGVPNLLKYALGLNPNLPAPAGALPVVQRETFGPDEFLTLTVNRNPAATDVTMLVEVTGNLAAPASWTTAGTVTLVNTPAQLKVRDSVPLTSGVQRYIRFRVTNP